MNSEVPITALSEDASWERLATQRVGRIVTNVAGLVDIVPVNYVVDDRSIVFRTAEGTKLSSLVVNHEVLFEVDSYDDQRGWSVVIRGNAHRIQKLSEIERAEELPLRPMVATVKMEFVRITVASLTGRAFVFGDEPDREAVQLG
ncbi:pyridoxamine 5'-phosphate oxidase family protein [Leucobacter sp. 1207-22]|uniref:pyridoxamine 5'-phosphate oxidase family protein n=1 Tax=Leucobacter sp. 1207-22 TaxID=2604456 RepID=UPI004063FC37